MDQTRWLGWGIASAWLLSHGLAAHAQQDRSAEPSRAIFSETFSDSLDKDWTWLRPAPERWCIRRGALEIRVMPGLADTVENALLRTLSLPDRQRGFAVEVTVTHLDPPQQQYEQAGITWYCDGRPVFKLVKEMVDGEVVVIPGRQPVTGDWIQLRLEVQGDRYVARYRTDKDAAFAEAATGNLPRGETEQLSLQCYHGPPDAEHWVRFDDFHVDWLDNE